MAPRPHTQDPSTSSSYWWMTHGLPRRAVNDQDQYLDNMQQAYQGQPSASNSSSQHPSQRIPRRSTNWPALDLSNSGGDRREQDDSNNFSNQQYVPPYARVSTQRALPKNQMYSAYSPNRAGSSQQGNQSYGPASKPTVPSAAPDNWSHGRFYGIRSSQSQQQASDSPSEQDLETQVIEKLKREGKLPADYDPNTYNRPKPSADVERDQPYRRDNSRSTSQQTPSNAQNNSSYVTPVRPTPYRPQPQQQPQQQQQQQRSAFTRQSYAGSNDYKDSDDQKHDYADDNNQQLHNRGLGSKLAAPLVGAVTGTAAALGIKSAQKKQQQQQAGEQDANEQNSYGNNDSQARAQKDDQSRYQQNDRQSGGYQGDNDNSQQQYGNQQQYGGQQQYSSGRNQQQYDNRDDDRNDNSREQRQDKSQSDEQQQESDEPLPAERKVWTRPLTQYYQQEPHADDSKVLRTDDQRTLHGLPASVSKDDPVPERNAPMTQTGETKYDDGNQTYDNRAQQSQSTNRPQAAHYQYVDSDEPEQEQQDARGGNSSRSGYAAAGAAAGAGLAAGAFSQTHSREPSNDSVNRPPKLSPGSRSRLMLGRDQKQQTNAPPTPAKRSSSRNYIHADDSAPHPASREYVKRYMQGLPTGVSGSTQGNSGSNRSAYYSSQPAQSQPQQQGRFQQPDVQQDSRSDDSSQPQKRGIGGKLAAAATGAAAALGIKSAQKKQQQQQQAGEQQVNNQSSYDDRQNNEQSRYQQDDRQSDSYQGDHDNSQQEQYDAQQQRQGQQQNERDGEQNDRDSRQQRQNKSQSDKSESDEPLPAERKVWTRPLTQYYLQEPHADDPNVLRTDDQRTLHQMPASVHKEEPVPEHNAPMTQSGETKYDDGNVAPDQRQAEEDTTASADNSIPQPSARAGQELTWNERYAAQKQQGSYAPVAAAIASASTVAALLPESVTHSHSTQQQPTADNTDEEPEADNEPADAQARGLQSPRSYADYSTPQTQFRQLSQDEHESALGDDHHTVSPSNQSAFDTSGMVRFQVPVDPPSHQFTPLTQETAVEQPLQPATQQFQQATEHPRESIAQQPQQAVQQQQQPREALSEQPSASTTQPAQDSTPKPQAAPQVPQRPASSGNAMADYAAEIKRRYLSGAYDQSQQSTQAETSSTSNDSNNSVKAAGAGGIVAGTAAAAASVLGLGKKQDQTPSAQPTSAATSQPTSSSNNINNNIGSNNNDDAQLQRQDESLSHQPAGRNDRTQDVGTSSGVSSATQQQQQRDVDNAQQRSEPAFNRNSSREQPATSRGSQQSAASSTNTESEDGPTHKPYIPSLSKYYQQERKAAPAQSRPQTYSRELAAADDVKRTTSSDSTGVPPESKRQRSDMANQWLNNRRYPYQQEESYSQGLGLRRRDDDQDESDDINTTNNLPVSNGGEFDDVNVQQQRQQQRSGDRQQRPGSMSATQTTGGDDQTYSPDNQQQQRVYTPSSRLQNYDSSDKQSNTQGSSAYDRVYAALNDARSHDTEANQQLYTPQSTAPRDESMSKTAQPQGIKYLSDEQVVHNKASQDESGRQSKQSKKKSGFLSKLKSKLESSSKKMSKQQSEMTQGSQQNTSDRREVIV